MISNNYRLGRTTGDFPFKYREDHKHMIEKFLSEKAFS